jgi:hypothetical protein
MRQHIKAPFVQLKLYTLGKRLIYIFEQLNYLIDFNCFAT